MLIKKTELHYCDDYRTYNFTIELHKNDKQTYLYKVDAVYGTKNNITEPKCDWVREKTAIKIYEEYIEFKKSQGYEENIENIKKSVRKITFSEQWFEDSLI